MIQRNTYLLVLALGATVVLTGCTPKMTIEELRAMMPERPAELDKLNAFAGTWEWEGKTTVAGLDQVLKTTGSSEATWDGDRWYLVSREVGHIEVLGDMQGLEAWTYDTYTSKFRGAWVDNTGSTGTGEAWHDEKTNTWHFRATSHGPCGKTSITGHVKVLDEDTMEWTFTEYAGLIKTMEMTGTGTRR